METPLPFEVMLSLMLMFEMFMPILFRVKLLDMMVFPLDVSMVMPFQFKPA